ncbi:SLC13 family permease [Defluviitalea phaphyphila]|uniref:SLC13 family permease n=1 Tax=Defluviitalea phaphyphila TaxID=1473580 RepID=UPI000731D2FC|nr:SLC13 family permease [Defluviitalea phaphyphila]
MAPKSYVDKKPIIFLFKEYKNVFLTIAIFLLFYLFMTNKNIPKDMSIEAYHTLGIFLLAVFLWITDIIPLAITSLMVMGLLSLFNVLEAKKIYSFFGNESVFFIIGSFIMAASISTSRLSERCTYFVMYKFGKTPTKLVLGIFYLTAFLSHWIPEHAVAAFVFPILISISEKLDLKPGSILGKYMFLALAWGCVIGGVVTFLGGARNPLAIGILQETTGQNIRFIEWIIAVAPPSYILIFLISIYLKKKVKASLEDIKSLQDFIKSNHKPIGKIGFKEIKTIIIFTGTIFMWIFYSERFGIANISLISATLLFVFHVIKWEDVKKEINWSAILMYGGAIAMGKCMEETGLLNYISNKYLLNFQNDLFLLMIVIAIISIFLTEGISNVAVIVILLPIVIGIMMNIGLNPKLGVYLVAVPAGLAFMFPISSPPNAIAYSSGFIPFKEQLKIGFILNIISVIVYIIFALLYWPLLGIY